MYASVWGVSTYTIPSFVLDLINFILFNLQMLSTIEYYQFINEWCVYHDCFMSGEMLWVARCLALDRWQYVQII